MKTRLIVLFSFILFSAAGTAQPSKPPNHAAEKAPSSKPPNPAPEIAPSLQPPTPDMILVEGGTFKMGSLTDSSGQGAISVHANYQVSLSGFSIGKYEVTQAEWTAVMGVNLSQHQGCGDCPVEDVSFNDIQLFLQSLNKMTGRHYLLPTSAQWEFAARGGNKTKGYKYAGSDDIDEVAWYGGEFIDSTHRVGRKHPNELGICDMSGNVEEWCSDFFDPNGPFRQGAETNPYGPSTGAGHTIRGGSWGAHPTQCGVLGSHIGYPNDRNAHVGFRLVLAP